VRKESKKAEVDADIDPAEQSRWMERSTTPDLWESSRALLQITAIA
jgi:hypothetical protein